MPYGKALIVDDVEINLYVAEGMLLPYEMNVEMADSGFAAIEKIENGNSYDIIFMDHMMPKMDGIETAEKLRAMGYRGAIVVLTANALVDNDGLFSRHGFDGFFPKPIDARQLNEVLNTFIRDKHPEEAKKYQSLTAAALPTDPNPGETRAKLLRVFRRDAEKAVVALRETGDDMKLFTTAVHAMKSALANIGETEESQMAAALEKAGHDGDMGFIAANTERFIQALESLISGLSLAQAVGMDVSAAAMNVAEDSAFLQEQLQAVQAACAQYDDAAAYAALDRLKEKQWKPQTSVALEDIRDMLFLHSDFDGAAEQAGGIME
jgi:CheY-like chemotaxis protein